MAQRAESLGDDRRKSLLERVARMAGGALPRIALYAVGLALVRLWRSWIFRVALTEMADVTVVGLVPRDLFTLGTILGTLLTLLCLWRRRSLVRDVGLVASAALTAAASALVVVGREAGLFATSGYVAATVVVASFGFAFLMATWVEWLGFSAPVVVFGSYLIAWPVSAGLSACLKQLDTSLAATVALAGAIASIGIIVLQEASRLQGEGERVRDTLAELNLRAVRAPGANLRVVYLVVVAFSLIYSIGSSYTGLQSGNNATLLGETLPVAVLVGCLVVWGKDFDYVKIYRFALLILAMGFAAATVASERLELIQVCMSAGNMMVMTLATTFVCGMALLQRVSAAWTYGFLSLGWYAAALLTRVVMRACGFASSAATLLFAGIAAAVLLALVMVLFREADLLSQWNEVCAYDTNDLLVMRCQCLAEQGGLGQRESGVLALLAQGKTQAEIAEQLFIAPGTVRAHINHVYEKLGVHSRAELDDMVSSVEVVAS